MRLLVDANLSPRVATALATAGHNDTTPQRQAEIVLAALTSTPDELAAGCIVTLSKGRLRVRSLPIG